ncbi:MAG TPA: AAA family ATPase [Thermoanaerobaculia bacterium]|nr:AAA family ATPase [Thermoanaerobaculia bacterium]
MRTITFYSYKGGVGRTLVVANVARYLARFGQKVFVVDFDLEAPGLHYKFGLGGQIESGLVDYLHGFVTQGEVGERIGSHVVSVDTGSAAGSLHLLPAGPAPSGEYWRKLARINWHELFYSDEPHGIPFFLELKEKIAAEFQPDFLLIDSRTGITEVGGVATSLLADQVVCLLIYNQENLEGAREVLRSVRGARRLPNQAPVEVLPVLTRIPEQDGQQEERIVREVREFLNEEAATLSATLDVQEVLVVHSDPELQLGESLRIGGTKALEESTLLRDYLHLFARLVPRNVIESYMEPLIREVVEKETEDPRGARKDFEALVSYSYHPEICRELLGFYREQKIRQVQASVPPVRRELYQFLFGVEADSGQSVSAPGPLQDLLYEAKLSRAPFRRVPLRREVHWGFDLRDLSESGWGIVLGEANPQSVAILEALRPLLEWRATQAHRRCGEYRYKFGDSALHFMQRHRVGPGRVDPDLLPYYLLIVGSPNEIPQEFLDGLGLHHGVGRICFDTLEEYRNYASSVVKAEAVRALRGRKIALFAPQNPGDPATERTCESLARPLAEALTATTAHGWEVDALLGDEATKKKLAELFENSPSLLFTVSQTLVFPWGDPRQVLRQGALVCQDWPGPVGGSVNPAFYFSAEDLSDDARIHGLISVHVGSYTAGTAGEDGVGHARGFLSRLAQRLLGHPSGGALALIGQFGRSWTASFGERMVESEVRAFEGTFRLLMQGYPVGAAMDFLRQRYADLSAGLVALLDESNVDQGVLADLWGAAREMRSYTLLGDPAVRLPLELDTHEPNRRRRMRA